MAVELKNPEQIEAMRAAGRVVRKVLEYCRSICEPGTTTGRIDQEAGRLIEQAGVQALFKNYPTYRPGEGFPGHVCISVNDEVVHGIPGDRQIADGDIVSIDCGVRIGDWCGDAATTILVGSVPSRTRELCRVTEHVLNLAVANIRPGRRWSQIARLMQGYAESAGFSVVREYVGHGIGRRLHEDPKVPNFVSPELLGNDIVLREGMVLAIEPMCNQGSRQVMEMADGWTVRTADRQPSAHYEHTVAVTAQGADVLTDGR
jgi:methionyl aminopeptidase